MPNVVIVFWCCRLFYIKFYSMNSFSVVLVSLGVVLLCKRSSQYSPQAPVSRPLFSNVGLWRKSSRNGTARCKYIKVHFLLIRVLFKTVCWSNIIFNMVIGKCIAIQSRTVIVTNCWYCLCDDIVRSIYYCWWPS